MLTLKCTAIRQRLEGHTDTRTTQLKLLYAKNLSLVIAYRLSILPHIKGAKKLVSVCKVQAGILTLLCLASSVDVSKGN